MRYRLEERIVRSSVRFPERTSIAGEFTPLEPQLERVLSERSTVVAAREQAFCSLAAEAVILDLKAGVYYSLNEVGARIWYLIQEPKSVSDIRDTILQEFDVERDRCERDLLRLLQDLADKELIRVQNEKAA